MIECERCHNRAERADTEREQWFCPRCGVWLHPDGAEIGPAISFEEAKEKYEKFAIDTAVAFIKEAEVQTERKKKLDALVEHACITPEQRDRLLYPGLYEWADKAAEYLATPQSSEDPK